MSASGTMRGPWMKTPLLLLLLLTTTLLRTVSCQDEYSDYSDGEVADENVEEAPLEDGEGTEDGDPGVTDPPPDPDPSSLPEPTSSAFTTLSPGEVPDETSDGSEEPGSGEGTSPPPDGTAQPPEDVDEHLGFIIIIIPVALVAVIIAVISGIFMHRRLNQKVRNPEVHTEDPYFEGPSTEKVPMPMFEEDVPSVLELEMEELDEWMKKDGDTPDGS